MPTTMKTSAVAELADLIRRKYSRTTGTHEERQAALIPYIDEYIIDRVCAGENINTWAKRVTQAKKLLDKEFNLSIEGDTKFTFYELRNEEIAPPPASNLTVNTSELIRRFTDILASPQLDEYTVVAAAFACGRRVKEFFSSEFKMTEEDDRSVEHAQDPRELPAIWMSHQAKLKPGFEKTSLIFTLHPVCPSAERFLEVRKYAVKQGVDLDHNKYTKVVKEIFADCGLDCDEIQEVTKAVGMSQLRALYACDLYRTLTHDQANSKRLQLISHVLGHSNLETSTVYDRFFVVHNGDVVEEEEEEEVLVDSGVVETVDENVTEEAAVDQPPSEVGDTDVPADDETASDVSRSTVRCLKRKIYKMLVADEDDRISKIKILRLLMKE